MQIIKKFYFSLSFKYLMGIITVLSLILGGIFYMFFKQERKFLYEEVYKQAEILVDQIILTRKWIADIGGVYVLKRKGLYINPYLSKPFIKCGDKIFLKRNPAMVTRELSDYAFKNGKYFFKLSSNFLINPANAPDDTESYALRIFDRKKAKEVTQVEYLMHKKFYRLIRPLYIKKSCLTCHMYQGYNIGELRGCISVLLPLSDVDKKLCIIKKYYFFSSLLIIFFTILIIYFLNYFLVIKPVNSIKERIERFKENYLTEFEKSSRKDEIGELKNNFFNMANIIKNNHEIMQKEIEKATEELKRKNKLKTDFLATVSHELRTPLTTIQGGIEYLSKVLTKKENKEFIEIIDKNIKNLILMVNNLIDIARIEIGRLELELKKEKLNNIIEEILVFFKGYADEKNIEFEKINFKKEFFVYLDRKRINQVLINILHNAIKFSPENDKITISIDETDESIKISISNNTDHELDEKNISTFFLKYKHLKSSKEKGSGLGLAIAKGIMLAHKGDIKVKLIDKNRIKFIIIFNKKFNLEAKNGTK